MEQVRAETMTAWASGMCTLPKPLAASRGRDCEGERIHAGPVPAGLERGHSAIGRGGVLPATCETISDRNRSIAEAVLRLFRK